MAHGASDDRPAPSYNFPPRRPSARNRLSSTPSATAALYAKAAEEAERNPNLRRISLLGSFLVALSAGSNYAFSSWAPQMQEAAHLSSTSLNVVGLAGNAGVYLSGPFVGRWVDKRGPKEALVFGAILVAAGYASLSASLTGRWSFHSTSALAFFNLLTGLGNSAAFAAAMNAQAKSWDGTKRGSATAFVLSGFGLSAFFYSTLSHSLFPGNTADYLLLLSLGSAAFYILGYFIIKVLPPADSPILRRMRTSSSSGSAGVLDSATTTGANGDDPEAPGAISASRSSLNGSKGYNRRRSSSDIGARVWLNPDELSSGGEDEDGLDDEEQYGGEDGRAQERQGLLRNSADGGNAGGGGGGSSDARAAAGESLSGSASASAAASPSSTGAVDITGRRLIKNTDFILLFSIMAAISGSGLLLINNCGTITRTLYDYNKRKNGSGEIFAAVEGSGLLSGGAGSVALPASGTSAAVAGGRGWPEFLHSSLRLFGSSVNTNKVAYHHTPKTPLLVLGRPFASRAEALASASSAAVATTTTTMGTSASATGDLSGLKLDEHALVQQLQAHQVSAISLGNALGRIVIGLLSDVLVNYTSPPKRVWLLTLVCLLAVSSQALAAMPNVITTVQRLLIVSSLTGLMYGTLFGISPSLAFEWFGVKHFSQNWGIVSLSPVVAGNAFNLLFGRVFDSHVPASSPSHQCPFGEECYRSVFVVTTVCCLIATGLSVVLIVRRAGWPTTPTRR